jgi:hypothetical protein
MALDDPFSHGFADTARPGQAVGAKAAATQKPFTAVGPSRYSPSGEKPSGPLSSITISARSRAGTRRIAFSIKGVKRSHSGGRSLLLKSVGMPSSAHGAGCRS